MILVIRRDNTQIYLSASGVASGFMMRRSFVYSTFARAGKANRKKVNIHEALSYFWLNYDVFLLIVD